MMIAPNAKYSVPSPIVSIERERAKVVGNQTSARERSLVSFGDIETEDRAATPEERMPRKAS
jgi:hypothetical protein